MSQLNMNKSGVFKKLMTFGCILTLLSGSPLVGAAKNSANPTVKVINVLPTELFYTGRANDLLWRDACDSWNLTARQIEQFFKLSREYQEGQEHIEYSKTFDWAHCNIVGTLKADNAEWRFEINASGAAEWRSQNRVRTWGCTDPKCRQYLIPEEVKPAIPPNPEVRIVEISPAQYDKRYDLIESSQELEETYCDSWSLTAEQAQRFFKVSDEYLEGRFQLFHWLPCNVSGVLETEGRRWNFIINQAATGIWRDGDTVRLWSCTGEDCKQLNLMLPVDELEHIDSE